MTTSGPLPAPMASSRGLTEVVTLPEGRMLTLTGTPVSGVKSASMRSLRIWPHSLPRLTQSSRGLPEYAPVSPAATAL